MARLKISNHTRTLYCGIEVSVSGAIDFWPIARQRAPSFNTSILFIKT